MKLDGCNALITGASSGIGREFARALANRAKTLVLVARREQRLIELRDELRDRVEVHTRIVDLTERAQIDALVDWLNERRIDIDLLINNAGVGDMGPFATINDERITRMIDVNTTALTLLTRKLLPPMIARKRGAILNVSSSAAFLPISEFSVYAATKAYVNSFSEGLRQELRGSGVNVCALCPGPVRTEFVEAALRPGQEMTDEGPAFVYVSAEHVAESGLRAIERDLPLRIPGAIMKIGMAIVRAMPMSILRRAARSHEKRTRQKITSICI